jgi:hypothetical protein
MNTSNCIIIAHTADFNANHAQALLFAATPRPAVVMELQASSRAIGHWPTRATGWWAVCWMMR